jgi:CHAT domain-containing protein/Tfp pilus assembly protein PilF
MKRYITNLVFYFVPFPLYLFAQNKTNTPQDSAFFHRLLIESDAAYKAKKFDFALVKADSAIQIGEQLIGKETQLVANALGFKGGILREMNKFDEAIFYHEKSLAICLKLFGGVHQLVAQSYSFLGTLYRFKGNYQKSLDYLLLSVGIREKIFGKDNLNMIRPYNNLGAAYLDVEDFQHALEYDHKSLNLVLKFQPENVDYIARQYHNIAKVYNTIGQFGKAKDYYQKVLSVQRKIYKNDTVDIAWTYTNMGNLYNDLEDYDKAIDYFYKALNIQLKIPIEVKNETEMSFRGLGMSYLFKGDYEKAILLFKQAIDVLIKIKGIDHPDIGDFYNNIGLCFFKNEKIDSSLFYLNAAHDLRLKVSPTEDSETAKYYLNLGLCFDHKKEYDKALDFFQKSLKINERIYGVQSLALTTNYIAQSSTYIHKKAFKKALEYLDKTLISGHYTKKSGVSLIDKKGDVTQALKLYALTFIRLYETMQDAKYLEQAVDYAEQAVNAINFQEETLNTEGSKSLLKTKTYDVYEAAIKANYLLFHPKIKDTLLQTTFQYAEQSKAKLLQAQLHTAHALKFADIPDSLLQQETTLRESVAYYEKKRQEKYNKGILETDSSVLAISSLLFEIQGQYDSLKTEILRNYPQYYSLKYNFNTVDVSAVQQKLLSPNQTLLEYFVGDSSIFIFTINQKDFKVLEVKNDFKLDSLVRLMRRGITGYHLAGEKDNSDSLKIAAPIAYTEGASKLYEKLIAPVKNQLKEQLIIVPDGSLNYIPFEALLVKKDEKAYRFKSHTYLLDEHQISYTYSATLLNEMREKVHFKEPTKPFLGMAPYFTSDTSQLADLFQYDNDIDRAMLQPLPAAGQEISNISTLMKGKPLYGKEATEDTFRKTAPQYRIIHLSTHGKANDKLGDYSYLAFNEIKDSIENELLYVRELYNISLNADMVVLSACETGIGQMQRGEGVVSLARAFAFAGAKSIVTTLWSVTDEKSKILMIDFYKNLVRGRSKDEALWNAKKRFIKKVNGDPFYWSGFIGIGDMRALKK